MSDCIAEVEALFRKIADRYGLQIRPVEAPVEVRMEMPVQEGLAFKIELGLQNNFQLDLFAEGLWVEQTFPKDTGSFEEMVHGLIDGSYRIAVYSIDVFGHSYVWKRQLEKPNGTGWQPVFRHYSAIKLPFRQSSVMVVRNTEAKKLGP